MFLVLFDAGDIYVNNFVQLSRIGGGRKETHADDVNVLVFCLCTCSTISGDVDITFPDEYVAWWHIVVFEGYLRRFRV